MNFLKLYTKNNKGSSSILVILIMVTLIVLGLIALMSTFSELKLARKNAEWTKTYYVLDSKAEIFLSEIDDCLKKAALAAGAYISDKAYENNSKKSDTSMKYPKLPENTQNSVYNAWQKANASNSEPLYTENLYKKLYLVYSLQNLKSSGIDGLSIKSGLDSGKAGFFEGIDKSSENGLITVSTTISEGTGNDIRSMLITISVKAAEPYNTSAGKIANDKKGSGIRYDISSWKELPKKFKYEDTLDFENLEVE